MHEQVLKTQISDIKLEAIIFNEAFRLKSHEKQTNVMAQLKHIHNHSTYELFVVLEGGLTIVDENGSAVYENTAIIIPPGFNHYSLSDNTQGYCMYFSIEPSKKEENGLYTSVSSSLKQGITTIPIGECERFYFLRLDDIFKINGKKENAIHLLSLIFASLFEHFEKTNNIPSEKLLQRKYEKYIHMIDTYISRHQNERIRLDDLAAELYLCPKQVSRIILKEYGMSLSELVNKRRLTVACMLLKYTNLDIGEISSMAGYEYENYFFTLFKKAYGTTPAQYRVKNRK